MTTTVKGLLKGLRYITQIFDEDKDQDMQIGFPTDVKHVAHIGSDGPAANTPSWMGDFKPQENENGQVVSRGDANNNNNQIGEGVGLQELLPPPEKEKEKLKQHKKTRRKTSETLSQSGSPPSSIHSNVSSSRRKSETGSPPPRRHSNVSTSSDMMLKQSKRSHNRSRHGSIDSSNDTSVRRKHRGVVSVSTEMEGSYPLSDGSGPTRKSGSRNRKLKGSGGGGGGEVSIKVKTPTKGKTENSAIVQSVDKCNNDNNHSDKD